MSDALSRNAADEAQVIRCHCLAHGRRTFSDLAEVCPAACQGVLEALKQVFAHEAVARREQMEGPARLADHQEESRPIMDGLKDWLNWSPTVRWAKPLPLCRVTGRR
jgi:transposase